MSDREYTPNSHKYKEEQKAADTDRKIEKVVTNGTAKAKKQGEFSKFASKIFSDQDRGDIKNYLIEDVAIPGIKNLILDFIIGGATKIFGGSRRSSSGGSRVSYRDYYSRGDSNRIVGGGSSSTASRPRFDFDEITFATRIDAEAVRDQMDDVIAKYGFVTVGDMYDMADLPQPFTSNKYGWTNIRNAEVRPANGGYVLKLPKASPID